jgi:hypothetical protein
MNSTLSQVLARQRVADRIRDGERERAALAVRREHRSRRPPRTGHPSPAERRLGPWSLFARTVLKGGRP